MHRPRHQLKPANILVMVPRESRNLSPPAVDGPKLRRIELRRVHFASRDRKRKE